MPDVCLPRSAEEPASPEVTERYLCDVCHAATGVRFTDLSWTCEHCRIVLLTRLTKKG
jgi:ribosomal protein L37AE/L43A